MVLEFETFRLDLDRRQLFVGDKEVHLSPKALQLLGVLIDARPKALSKADIHERLWPATFVADSNLASIVNEVRRALNDDAHSPKYIRTVHAFGYAFCSEPLSLDVRPHGTVAAKLAWDGGEGPLFLGRNIIGRDPDAAVRVDDRTISRHHAAIVIESSRVTLEDLQSKNGTFVDGTRLESAPVPLVDGTVFEVGSVKMVYREISTTSTATLYRS